ncbi:Rv3654c family TadE-like protein [Rothia mucilaginosa]|uniref:Rv3654c family TadE-like protein n=1 Tax=Rothia mucilaginosa TaxID=43675 RepID=UPI0028E72573|nr:Rv3654c family TadE-like protein [Rothia mucilaginosa]
MKKVPAVMANRSAVLAWSADEYSEEGSGTVLALTIIAALLVVTVVIAGLIGAVSANRRASAAADLSALAAADAYRGLTEGDPCAVAADLAARHGAHLESCTFPDRPETVEVTVAVPVAGPMGILGPARVRARAGAEHPEEEYAEEEHPEEEHAAGNAEELNPDEVAELEEELGVEQDSVSDPPEPENPPEPESPAELEKPAD